MNALLENWSTPFKLPPFDAFGDDDFAPAFEEAFKLARADVSRIANNPEPPTFANTIKAMEQDSDLLDRVGSVFFNLSSADTNETREAIQRDLSPKYAAFHSETMMNEALFERVRAVYEGDEVLSDEERVVCEKYYKMFVRAGSNLTGSSRTRFKEVMQRLAELGTTFSQNVLAEERNWELPLSKGDLEGLPEFLVSALESSAKARDQEGYLLTLTPSLIGPFMQFSPNRELRKTVSKAWKARGAQGGEHDNRAVIKETLELRAERARLLGYPNFASFKLEEEMAKTPQAVKDLLQSVWEPAKKRALKDVSVLSEMMKEDGINDRFQGSDWAYYAEKRKQKEHDLDEAELKPYLQLDNMIAASFDCASRLFGLSFEEISPALYHEDARAWEVKHGDRHMGVFVGDYFARASKRSGAWCSRFRPQSNMDEEIRPIVVNVCNFAKAPEGQATLLSFDDARTLFHEFGHALHTLLSDVSYPMISGTSVARDFVELPSQLYEHWLSVPEILSKHALHADTGEAMPQEMVDKVLASENADQGYDTVTYVASAMVDIEFHSNDAPEDPMQAQEEILKGLGIPPELSMRHASTHFQHVFSGDGYSSGYYSYMWSEVMDADAFEAFEETGDPFDPEMAQKLHKYIYSAGGSQDPGDLYVAFRGAMPSVAALLKGRDLAA